MDNINQTNRKEKDYFNNLKKNDLKNILKSIPANIFFKDLEGRYVFCSSFLDIEDDIIGKTSLDTNEDPTTAKRSYDVDKRIIETGMGATYVRKINSNGVEKYMEIIKNPVFDENGKMIGISGLVNDITARYLLEKKLSNLANKDSLTGAYNRTYKDYWLATWNKNEIYPVSLFSIDLNDLKIVNDNYGHSTGDLYIQTAAKFFSDNFGSKRIVIRMGGDEFIIISPNCDKEQASKYLEEVKERSKIIKISNNSIPLSFAIGCVTVDYFTDDLEYYMNSADREMYENKIEIKQKKLGALHK